MPLDMADEVVHQLSKMGRLTVLDLRFNHFQHKVVDILSVLKTFKNKVEVRLQYNYPQDDHIVDLIT